MRFSLDTLKIEERIISAQFERMTPEEFTDYFTRHPRDYCANRYFMELLKDDKRINEILGCFDKRESKMESERESEIESESGIIYDKS